VVIQHGNLSDCPRILQLERRLLLDAEDDNRGSADADLSCQRVEQMRRPAELCEPADQMGATHGACSSSDGLESVLDLEELR
jgi:hypothetical protein